MAAHLIQPSFAKGEIGPSVYGRVDTAMYGVALKTARNVFIHPHGGASNRPGTYFTGPVKVHSAAPRLIPFAFKTADQYMLEFGDLYMRVIRDGGHVLEDEQTITGVTSAQPGVVTIAAHGLSNGDEVYIVGVVGMTQLNGKRFTIANVTTDTFELTDQVSGADIDTSLMDAYLSAGSAARVFTLVTPYSGADLDELKFEQSADVMTLTHKSYAVRELSRTGHTLWALSTPTFLPSQGFPTALTVTKGTVGAERVRYRVTAVGVDESLPAVTAGVTLTSITSANPAVFTKNAHGLLIDDEVELKDFTQAGWTVFNNRRFKVSQITANTFTLKDTSGAEISSAGFVAWSTNGAYYRTFSEIRLDNISAITAAAPGVITVTQGHGIVAGDIVRIAGVVGMTQVNNRSFNVVSVTATTVTIESTSGYTAYVSGGSLWKINTANNVVNWTAVAGAVSYRVYKETNGVYGLLGTTETTTFTDDNLFNDYAEGPPRFSEPFFGAGNWPGAVGYFEQRRVFGGTTNHPDTGYYSRIGSPSNLIASVPQKADDAIIATLAARQVNEIRHLIALDDLLIFTSGSEWKVNAGPDQGFAADTLKQKPQSIYGSSHLRPIISGDVVIYCEENKSSVRSFGYTIQKDGYRGTKLDLLATHMLKSEMLVDWDYTHSPESRLIGVRSDGDLVTMTFEPDQEVIAWTTCDTNGDFERVGVQRHSPNSREDTVYVVVKRQINGQTVRYIERLASRVFTDVQDCFFVDCGLTLDEPITVTGVSVTDPAIVTAPSHGLDDADIIDISDIRWHPNFDAIGTESQPSQLNGGTYTVVKIDSNTFSLLDDNGDAVDGSTFNAYLSDGFVRKTVTSVSGLDHLEGQTVVALANGDVFEDLVVEDGAVTFDEPVSRVHVGLRYTADIETLSIEAPRGTIQAKLKKLNTATVRLEQTRGLFIGPDIDNLTEMKQREFEVMGAPTAPFTGDKKITVYPSWGFSGRVFMRQKYPLPLTVLAVILDLNIDPT